MLVKSSGNANQTRIEVGDHLIGIGITHLVESLSRPPGPDSIISDHTKQALRAFTVSGKSASTSGYDFELAPLTPSDYVALAAEVSSGAIQLQPDTIPRGTMVVSFLSETPRYTLQRLANSPRANWAPMANSIRHWNIGLGKDDDFWAATFPSDDIAFLQQLDPSYRVGSIRFGLSVLEGSVGVPSLDLTECQAPTGRLSSHHFCLVGTAVGTKGLDTPFPIGLRTEIKFRPTTYSD